MAKIGIPLDVARARVRDVLQNAGSFGSAVGKCDFYGDPFVVALERLQGQEASDFSTGRMWPQWQCDAALRTEMDQRYPGDWIAGFYNYAALLEYFQAGEKLGKLALVDNRPLHIASAPRTLDTQDWRHFSVDFDKVIVLFNGAGQALLNSAAPNATLSEDELTVLIASAFSIIVSVYDDESWMVTDMRPLTK